MTSTCLESFYRHPSAGFVTKLIVAPADVKHCNRVAATPHWVLMAVYPSPVTRAKQHQPVRIRVVKSNKRANHHSLAWYRRSNSHGWLPFLSQPPSCPAAALIMNQHRQTRSFFGNPQPQHEQHWALGKGLVGAAWLSMKQKKPDFDTDLVFVWKTGHIKDDGALFTALTTPTKWAFRMGTAWARPSEPLTCNPPDLRRYLLAVPIRVRLLNVDNTLVYWRDVIRILMLKLSRLTVPDKLNQERWAILKLPRMRLDLGVIAPSKERRTVTI